MLHICEDSYVKLGGSRCLRRVKKHELNKYDELSIYAAKDYCSKDTKCIGIESEREKNDRRRDVFRLCNDATYTSTAWDKYQNLTNIFFRKAPYYGKYTLRFSTKTLHI